MKAPLPGPWLSFHGGTGAGGLGEEAPGERLPPAGCGRSHFPGDPAAGCAYHCPGCAFSGAPGAGRTGEWLQQVPQRAVCCSCLLTSGCASGLLPHLLSWLLCPGGDVCLVCLFAGFFHVPVMLLYPDVSKPLPGCLSSPLPKTYSGLCLYPLVHLPCLACFPFQGDGCWAAAGGTNPRLSAWVYIGRGGVGIS